MKVPVADFPGITTNWWIYLTRPNIYAKGAKPIGTGPFKYQSFTPGQQSVFVANRDYWRVDGGPYVDTMIVDSSFTDQPARLNAVLAGNADIVPQMPFALAKAHASSGDINVGAAPGLNAYYFASRVDLEPFKDPRVRLALKSLCDRPQMVESVFSGYARESNDLFGPGLPFFADTFPIRGHDPERAKSLLKAAGQENLQLTLLTSPQFDGMVQGATLYAQQAAAAGVKIRIQTVPAATYFTSQGPDGGYLKYPMFTSTTGPGNALPNLTVAYTEFVWSKGPFNETHFGSPQADKLLFDAIGETDASKAQDKWNSVQKLQYDEGGMVGFGTAAEVDGYAKRVRGVHTGLNGPVGNRDLTKAWLT